MTRQLKFLLLFSAVFLFANLAVAQTNWIGSTQDTVKFNLERANGIGPTGNSYLSLYTYADYEGREEFLALPKVKNEPENLSDVSRHLYIFDSFQFYYQNYVAGVISKSLFLQKATGNNWRIADTINLSAKPLACAVTVLAGVDADNNEVYIADVNNNNDYSDDVIHPLLKNAHLESVILKNSINVKTTIVNAGIFSSANVMLFIQRGRDAGKRDLMGMITQFDYARFSLNGIGYQICAFKEFNRKSVCIIPDRPYFSMVNRADISAVGQYVNIGGLSFKFLDYNFAEHKVTLLGEAASLLKLGVNEQQTTTAKDTNAKNVNAVSDQVGFLAPPLKGQNMNALLKNTADVSLDKLKGKYVFVDFWSTYCGPCIAELPHLNTAYKKYSRDKFEIIGVFDERDKKVTDKLFSTNNVVWPNILMKDKNTEMSGYTNVDGFPTSYLIDPNGRIVAYNLRGEDLMDELKVLIGN